MNVDKVDRAIIAQLSADSRLSVRALAERVHVSRSAVASRLQRLVADGVIEGFGARVDRKSIGLHVTALVIVKVERTFLHPVMKKTVRRSKKYHAHDEANVYKAGEVARIVECPPKSKLKTWEVLPKASA